VVCFSVYGISFEVETRRTDPDGVVAHSLDVVQLGGEGVVCPAARDTIGGVASCTFSLWGVSVGDDSTSVSRSTTNRDALLVDGARTPIILCRGVDGCEDGEKREKGDEESHGGVKRV